MSNGTPEIPATPTSLPARVNEAVGLRVSLIPTEELERKDPKQGFRQWLSAVIIAFVIIGGVTSYLWYLVYQASAQVSLIKDDTNVLMAKQGAIAETFKNATVIQTQLKGVSALLAGHRHATQVLNFLEQHTLEQVAFTTAALSDDGKLTLSAEARDYESLAGQVVEFKSASEVQSVNLSGISATADEKGNVVQVNFTLQVVFNPTLFATQTK
jgi:hypothetical protein